MKLKARTREFANLLSFERKLMKVKRSSRQSWRCVYEEFPAFIHSSAAGHPIQPN